MTRTSLSVYNKTSEKDVSCTSLVQCDFEVISVLILPYTLQFWVLDLRFLIVTYVVVQVNRVVKCTPIVPKTVQIQKILIYILGCFFKS